MLSSRWKYQSLSSPSLCSEGPQDVNLILHFINIKSEIVNKANSATKSYQNKNIFSPFDAQQSSFVDLQQREYLHF